MDGGRLATIAVVLAVAGVAGASLIDGRGSDGTPAATTESPPTTAAVAPEPNALGSLAEQLARLPPVPAGQLPGKIHRRLPTCRWRVTDLATGDDRDITPGGARCPLWLPGWRYAFSFAVEQSANAPIVRGIRVVAGARQVGRIRVPEAVTGGAAGTPGGRLALCLRGTDDATRVYTGARLQRIVAACDPVAFGEEFLYQTGGRFRDADGRVVLDLGRPPLFVHPVGNGLTVVATGDDRLQVYRGRRLLHERPLPDDLTETSVLDADADEAGDAVVLRIRRDLQSDLAVVRMTGGDVQESHVGSVLSTWMAPDGRSVAAVVAGIPVVLDAQTLIPRGRLTLEDGASLQAWTP